MWEMVIGANYSLVQMTTTSTWMQISLIIFSGFMFFAQIILLNMLITYMWDVYSKVRRSGARRGVTGCKLRPSGDSVACSG